MTTAGGPTDTRHFVRVSLVSDSTLIRRVDPTPARCRGLWGPSRALGRRLWATSSPNIPFNGTCQGATIDRKSLVTLNIILGILRNLHNWQGTVLNTFFDTFNLYHFDLFRHIFGVNLGPLALCFHARLDVFSLLRVSHARIDHDRHKKYRRHDNGGRADGYEALRRGLLGKWLNT